MNNTRDHRSSEAWTIRQITTDPKKTVLYYALSVFLILASFPLTAATPLALRVDVIPVSITPDGTLTTVEVQLAPPDRGRIGRQARMRVKLIQESKILAHILQDIDFDAQGLAQAQFTWKPGRYDLNLEVESLKGTAQGLWIGQIEIPSSLDQAPEPVIPTIETPATPPPTAPSFDHPEVSAAAAVMVAPIEQPPAETPAPAAASAKDSPVPDPLPVPKPVQASAVPEPIGPATAAVPAPSPPATTDQVSEPPVQEEAAQSQSPTPTVATGSVFAVLIDIDSSDALTVDRAAGIRAEIEQRSGEVSPITTQSENPNPAQSIDGALESLRTFSDARAVIVITDGRGKASRSNWKSVTASAKRSGIPIIVVGLWNKEFNPGTRKQLSLLATESGGSSYLLQPSESTARALANVDSALAANP